MHSLDEAASEGLARIALVPQDLQRAIFQARRLLRSPQETDLPLNVLRIIEFCAAKGVGFVLSRNVRAGNCRDARSKRYRLGHVGIPLYDEMKSIVCSAGSQAGEEAVVAMHCRGHMAIDFSSVTDLCNLQGPLIPLPEHELRDRFGMEFGTVNPILLELQSNETILNVFDAGVFEAVSKFPGTMMTNMGDHTWAIEFDPKELMNALKGITVGNITTPDVELREHELPRIANPKTIGIITGNGPDSGIALWKGINEYFVRLLKEHFLGDISLPKVSIISVPAMGLSMELDRREQATWDALSEAVRTFKNQKVELLALACHTTHYFTDQIRALFESDEQRFVSMADVVKKHVEENAITDVAILGINYVADLGKWSAYSWLNNYRVEQLSDDTLKKFHELGYEVKRMSDLHKSFQRLIGLIKNEVKSKTVIIALTELSILLQSQGKKGREGDKNIIDALELYAKAIAERALRMEA
jgi:aspartate racemase